MDSESLGDPQVSDLGCWMDTEGRAIVCVGVGGWGRDDEIYTWSQNLHSSG